MESSQNITNEINPENNKIEDNNNINNSEQEKQQKTEVSQNQNQNQIQEIQSNEVPEISNEIQSSQQKNQNPPNINPSPQNQQLNQLISQQGMSQAQVQPQLPPENKIIFLHPMINYCSDEKIREIESCPPSNIFLIVKKRIDDISLKLNDILKNHEKYALFGIYYNLVNIFLSNRQRGNDPQLLFESKDPKKILKISDFAFSEVLTMLNCQLTADQLNLILKSLTQKTSTLYSYDEFLKKVYNIQQEENGQMKEIYKQCSFYFNDYLYSFRHYIQDNKIDYKNAFMRCCAGITTLTFELFNKFLDEIGFKIGHQKEKEYIFSALCEDNYFAGYIQEKANVIILQKTLFDMAEQSDISEEDFLKSGNVAVNIKRNSEWVKNIKNYTEGSKQLYIENYKSFENIFKEIHEKCLKNDIKDFTTFFVESGEDISPEGDIEFEVFKKLMNIIGVNYSIKFDSLILKFKDSRKRTKDIIKLTDFISIYNLFIDDNNKDKNNNKSGEMKFEEEKDLIGTNLVPEKKPEYIFKNAHRQFTQEDIDYISELCSGIADIIIDELHYSVTNFFQSKSNKHGGYLYLSEFKEILENEFQINIEETEQDKEGFQLFFDFIISNKMVQGKDIIEIKKLIHIITYYSGKDGPSQETKNINNINNTNDSNQNNNINFIEENNFKGTNAPNPDDENLEDINTNIKNNNINNKKELIEIIKTDINTSAISFDKIISDFANSLYNNKIRFSNVFPSINLEKVINNQTISADDLRLGFKNANFDVNESEFSVLMTHFDPINKNTVLVEDLKHEIAKFQPKYFNQNYQKVDPKLIEKKLEKKIYSPPPDVFIRDKSKSDLLNGMNKIQSFLIRKNITPENFFYGKFDKKNRSENMQVNKENWKNAFIPKEKSKSDFIPYLEAKEVDAIYVEMNPKISDPIILSRIIDFFNKYMKKNENLINYNDKTTLNETIKNEIKILFDDFDINHNDQITFEDFYKCLKSVDHKATKQEANKILGDHSNSSNHSIVDRATFNKIIYDYIQKSLVIQKEEKNFIMNLFREADIDKKGYLTRNQIKYLIKNKINCNLTDTELDEILDKVDIQNENEIDIRDFIFLLDNINYNQINNPNMINTMSNVEDNEAIPIMNLNLNLNMHRKIRPKDFISLYTGLPLSFIPSFIREEQQKNNLLPSSCLKPLTKDDIFYEDIFPIEDIIYAEKIDSKKPYSGIIQTKKLKQITPLINCKIYFDDYATGVSSPDETLFETPNSQFKVVGRLLKICLFNNMYKCFVGNAISIDCIYKKEYQDRWYFEDDDSKCNNNIIIRYNEKDIVDIDVIFEFVLVIQKKVEQKIYTVETSCGWCQLPMTYLQTARKEKIPILGGSPMGVSDISENDIRKKRIGFIPKLATLFEGAIRSECPIKVKLFNDLSNDEKKNINYLPSLIVCHSAAIQMISLYRKELGEYILNHKDYLLKPIKDEFDLGNMFCKIADVTDAFRVMNEVWKEIVIDGGTSDQRNNENYLRGNFELFVKKINSVLYAEKFKYNPLDPTELPRGDIKLMQDRDILLNSALRSGLEQKYNKLGYKMEDYSYKPFTMDEINGQKGNTILEKIDEMITYIN